MPSFDVQRTLRDYWWIVRRRKWLFIVPFLVAPVVAGWRFYVTPKKYRAVGVLRRQDPVLLRTPVAERAAEEYDLARGRIRQRRELIRILCAENYMINYDRKLGLEPEQVDSRWEAWLNEPDWDHCPAPARWARIYENDELAELVPEIRRGIGITSISGRRGSEREITITFTHQNPEWAEKICRGLMDAYQQGSVSRVAKALESASQQYTRSLDLLDLELATIKGAVYTFEKDNVGTMPEALAELDQRLKTRKAEVGNLEARVDALMKDIAALKETLAKTPETVVEEQERVRNPQLDRLDQEIYGYKADLRRVLKGVTQEHPRVKELRELIKDAEQERMSLPATIEGRRVVKRNPELGALNIRLGERTRQRAEAVDALKKSKGQLDTMNSLKMKELARYRDHIELKDRYAKKIAERKRLEEWIEVNQKELAIHTEKEGIKFTVQEYPLRPRDPAEPDPFIFLIMGLLFGAAGGVGLVTLVEHTDHSLRTAGEATRYLDVPVVGTIGIIRTPTRRRLLTALRVVRWMVLLAVVGGAVVVGIHYWYHPRYGPKLAAFIKNPARQIHRWRWTGA